MVIKSIESTKGSPMKFEVGENGVESIELTEHGGENTNIYKVTDSDGEYVYIGLIAEQERVIYENDD